MIKNRTTTIFLTLLFVAPAITAHASDVQTITHGREVDLENHLVPGKYVLFDFYADWCGPCRAMEPHLLDLAGRHSEKLALRKVDIINWESPVSQQYRISSIPYMVLYGPDGNRLTAGDPQSVLRSLDSALGGRGSVAPGGRATSGLIPLLAIAAIFAVAVGLVARRRRSPAPTGPTTGSSPPLPLVDTAADPGDPAIWFALLQGSLEGPFTRAQLDELIQRGTLEQSSKVRRRGDASWTVISDVVD